MTLCIIVSTPITGEANRIGLLTKLMMEHYRRSRDRSEQFPMVLDECCITRMYPTIPYYTPLYQHRALSLLNLFVAERCVDPLLFTVQIVPYVFGLLDGHLPTSGIGNHRRAGRL